MDILISIIAGLGYIYVNSDRGTGIRILWSGVLGVVSINKKKFREEENGGKLCVELRLGDIQNATLWSRGSSGSIFTSPCSEMAIGVDYRARIYGVEELFNIEDLWI